MNVYVEIDGERSQVSLLPSITVTQFMDDALKTRGLQNSGKYVLVHNGRILKSGCLRKQSVRNNAVLSLVAEKKVSVNFVYHERQDLRRMFTLHVDNTTTAGEIKADLAKELSSGLSLKDMSNRVVRITSGWSELPDDSHLAIDGMQNAKEGAGDATYSVHVLPKGEVRLPLRIKCRTDQGKGAERSKNCVVFVPPRCTLKQLKDEIAKEVSCLVESLEIRLSSITTKRRGLHDVDNEYANNPDDSGFDSDDEEESFKTVRVTDEAKPQEAPRILPMNCQLQARENSQMDVRVDISSDLSREVTIVSMKVYQHESVAHLLQTVAATVRGDPRCLRLYCSNNVVKTDKTLRSYPSGKFTARVYTKGAVLNIRCNRGAFKYSLFVTDMAGVTLDDLERYVEKKHKYDLHSVNIYRQQERLHPDSSLKSLGLRMNDTVDIHTSSPEKVVKSCRRQSSFRGKILEVDSEVLTEACAIPDSIRRPSRNAGTDQRPEEKKASWEQEKTRNELRRPNKRVEENPQTERPSRDSGSAEECYTGNKPRTFRNYSKLKGTKKTGPMQRQSSKPANSENAAHSDTIDTGRSQSRPRPESFSGSRHRKSVPRPDSHPQERKACELQHGSNADGITLRRTLEWHPNKKKEGTEVESPDQSDTGRKASKHPYMCKVDNEARKVFLGHQLLPSLDENGKSTAEDPGEFLLMPNCALSYPKIPQTMTYTAKKQLSKAEGPLSKQHDSKGGKSVKEKQNVPPLVLESPCSGTTNLPITFLSRCKQGDGKKDESNHRGFEAAPNAENQTVKDQVGNILLDVCSLPRPDWLLVNAAATRESFPFGLVKKCSQIKKSEKVTQLQEDNLSWSSQGNGGFHNQLCQSSLMPLSARALAGMSLFGPEDFGEARRLSSLPSALESVVHHRAEETYVGGQLARRCFVRDEISPAMAALHPTSWQAPGTNPATSQSCAKAATTFHGRIKAVCLSDDVLRQVAQELSSDWEDFAVLGLKLKIKDINGIKKDNPSFLLQAFSALDRWRQSLGNQASKAELQRLLKACDKRSIAEAIENLP